MPRQMLVSSDEGSQVLRESLAHDEAQLQQLLRDHPGLLPLEDLGLVGPPLVVGKETSVPSGAIDLVLLARGGEIVLVEFKTGPQNPDFRGALAQVLDYGSDLWGMSIDDFERVVALRYFSSSQAVGTMYERCPDLDAAISRTWRDDQRLSDEELAAFKDRLANNLTDGTFTFVVGAQRFTEPMERTVQYLNAMHRRSRFCLIEVVRFTGDNDEEVFEARTVSRPEPLSSREASRHGAQLTRETLLEQLGELPLASAVARFLDGAEANGLHLVWGTSGLSVRMRGENKGPLATVAWFFPPKVVGWLGLNNLVLGHDPSSPGYGAMKTHIDSYMARVELLGGKVVTNGGIRAMEFTPEQVVSGIDLIVDALDALRMEGGL